VAGLGPAPPPVVCTENLPLQTKSNEQRSRADDHAPSGCLGGVSEHLSELAAAGAGTPRHIAEGWSAFADMVHHRSSKWRTGDIGGFMGRRHAAHADEHYAEVRGRRAHPHPASCSTDTARFDTQTTRLHNIYKHIEPPRAFEADQRRQRCMHLAAAAQRLASSDAPLMRWARAALTRGKCCVKERHRTLSPADIALSIRSEPVGCCDTRADAR